MKLDTDADPRSLQALIHGAAQADRADVRVLVAQWEARRGQPALSIPMQQPSRELWAAIAARTPALPSPHAARPAQASWLGWLGWLKPADFGFGGIAAGVIAASVLFVIAPTVFISSDQIAMRSGEKLPQSYVGLLTDAQGNGKLRVSSLRHGKTMTVKVIVTLENSATPASPSTTVVFSGNCAKLW